ncbi:hypothetical protein D3C73_1387190 [compost metagenome]
MIARASRTATNVSGTRISGGGSRMASMGSAAPKVKATAEAKAAFQGLTMSSSWIFSSAERWAAKASCSVSSCATVRAVSALSPFDS